MSTIRFGKIVTILSCGAVIGIGLCGTGMAISTVSGDGGWRESFFTVVYTAGMYFFWLSLLGLLLTFFLWVVVSIVRTSTDNPYWPHQPPSTSNELSITTPPNEPRKDSDD